MSPRDENHPQQFRQDQPPFSASASTSWIMSDPSSTSTSKAPTATRDELANPISDTSIPVSRSWPRRVAKACCNCRKDKIRCDGTRPCSGCTRKGYSAEHCIEGCLQCRRSRVRCDGASPCSRCAQLNILCGDDIIMNGLTAESSKREISDLGQVRTRERAKLACLACRRDNKKCEDQRPCSRCLARQEDCIHVSRGPKMIKTRCKGCRLENKKCEEQRPCKYCVESSCECLDEPRKGRGHGIRVKAACVACRRDKIQCDTERPCRSCLRRGQECLDRTCSCSELGPGHECPVCRAHRYVQAESGREEEAVEDILDVSQDDILRSGKGSQGQRDRAQQRPSQTESISLGVQAPTNASGVQGFIGPLSNGQYHPQFGPHVLAFAPTPVFSDSTIGPAQQRDFLFNVLDPSIVEASLDAARAQERETRSKV